VVWSVEEDRYGMVSLGRLWSGRESVGCLGWVPSESVW
jgi:hypothetical protein